MMSDNALIAVLLRLQALELEGHKHRFPQSDIDWLNALGTPYTKGQPASEVEFANHAARCRKLSKVYAAKAREIH